MGSTYVPGLFGLLALAQSSVQSVKHVFKSQLPVHVTSGRFKASCRHLQLGTCKLRVDLARLALD